jgi:hypothetical protein
VRIPAVSGCRPYPPQIQYRPKNRSTRGDRYLAASRITPVALVLTLSAIGGVKIDVMHLPPANLNLPMPKPVVAVAA